MNDPQSGVPRTQTLPASPSPGVVGDVVPARIGEYVLRGELGHGGMGVVYRAEDLKLKREVAVKVMLPQFAANPQAKARFVREARAQAKVEHDHVAAIHRVDEHDGLPYLVMPLLKGMTLHAALRANPRPPLMEVIRMGREVAEGLAAAHESGLVHRDIKPANVWLEGKKLRVKVLDFGLARVIDTDAEGTDGPVTREGAVVGTPSYMSPEQARGLAVDGRTDLFSLGIVLYQMTTGELPFRGPNTLAILTSLAIDNPPPPSSVNAAVPEHLSEFVLRLLAKDPAHRPPTAEAAAEELRAIESEMVNAVRVVPLGAPMPLLLGSAEPDPFADLDATERNTASEPARAVPATKPTAAANRGFPMWAAAGVVLLVVAGVVGVAVSQMKKKPAEVVEAEPPRKQEKPPEVRKPPDPQPQPPTRFFNGKDLTGWTGSLDHWRVDQGEIVGTFPEGGVADETHLSSTREFGDFDLSFQVRLRSRGKSIGKAAGASGVLIRGVLQEATKSHGTRCQFGGQYWGGVTAGAAASTTRPNPEAIASVKADDFNDFQIRCIGTRVKVTVNGITAVEELRERIRPKGVIAWCMGAAAEEIRIRNIRFHDLTVQADVDRLAARYVLSVGGLVRVNGDPRDIRAIADLPSEPFQLTWVHLIDNKAVTDAGLESLRGCKNLSVLSVFGSSLTDAGLGHLRDCTNLTVLNLGNTSITNQGLANFRGCTKVRILGLNSSKVTDEGLAVVKDWKELTYIDLGNSRISDSGLAVFKEWRNLRELYLGYTNVTDEGLAHLKDCKTFIELNLNGTKVTNDGLAHFRDCKSLELLSLRNTNITDEGLKHIETMPALKKLFLTESKVTAEGVRKLRIALPNCAIEWEPAKNP